MITFLFKTFAIDQCEYISDNDNIVNQVYINDYNSSKLIKHFPLLHTGFMTNKNRRSKTKKSKKKTKYKLRKTNTPTFGQKKRARSNIVIYRSRLDSNDVANH